MSGLYAPEANDGMPVNTYGFHKGYTPAWSDCSPTRTKPSGAVASGETNVCPPNTSAWKTTQTTNANTRLAHRSGRCFGAGLSASFAAFEPCVFFVIGPF